MEKAMRPVRYAPTSDASNVLRSDTGLPVMGPVTSADLGNPIAVERDITVLIDQPEMVEVWYDIDAEWYDPPARP